MSQMYGVLVTSIGQKTDFASPIAVFPWHETRRRDKWNRFFSLDDQRKTPSGTANRSFCLQYALQEARWMQGFRSCSQET